MTWREGYLQWCSTLTDRVETYTWDDAFLAGAKWAAGDLIDNAVWESRDIVYEFQKRLEEE